ncbi:dorsal-ventral patterning protein Sog [Eupeodes corollae]|uniref:dorsal-ventral patterning protein Sog n=1 Tax=Eupeodes corollae TaxID=290404 RepID=UPI002490C800|nr:dorsal-ventral patterning protein Sog [Eupeodes corollae]XP_055909089.1 dorsal-ventral patterning protein Sog [Eupeodes corollae]XP_055909090.1 dorsal-ventral patterning protein Sog [Eupeodes corollae]XP_055909091.1 dorsal-ventral patterning protein Sog [Eupeodes corollae]
MALLLNLLGTFKVVFLLLSVFLATINARRHSPLLVEDPEARRPSRQGAECQFGKTLHELGSTWWADLGPPFGVMYCIKCECVAVPKKRRIVARVQCRNIKNECPPANCDDPILLPGKCCKACPGESIDPEIALDVPMPVNNEEEERNMKHFAALLTGRTSYFLKGEEMKAMYSTHNPQNVVATGRFLFHKKNLYYSFYVSSKITRPRAIQFVDDSGTILEEHNLTTPLNGPLSVYQNTTGKICGVWRRVPRDYKRLLRDERLHVVLLWGSKFQAELALAGKVAKYTALQTELFSTLIEPAPGTKSDQMAGAGGTAIVSTSSGVASSVHLTLVFNGVFSPEEYVDAPISIRIESSERKEIILDEVQKVRKPSAEVNVLELSSPISIQNLRLLSRGKLVLIVESKKNPNLKLQGQIVTRATCELFQTLLAPHSYESKAKASGLAWVYMNTDGTMAYNILTDHLNAKERPEISLIEDIGKRKTVLEDLTQSFNFDQAIGTIDKISPKIIESLYGGELGVNIAIESDANLIRGRLTPRPVADARDSAEPILLKRQDTSSPAHLMGMAWIAIDNDCNLHYEVTVNGYFTNQQEFQIYLEEKPIEAIGAPITRKMLEEFSGPYMEGYVLGMAANELIKLETSVCYLEIYSKERQELLLRGKLKSTKVPSHCFPSYTDNNVPSVIVPGDHNGPIIPETDTKCYHSGRFYDEAEQWRSLQESCTMCACQHGRVTCDAIKCPVLKCRQGEDLILRDGECCPTCISPNIVLQTNNSAERGCRLGDQFHLAGATWHPYLPPNGFDTCATCTCDPLTLEIRCPRMACPALTCPEKLAYRPNKKACCKVCPEGKTTQHGDKSGPINQNILQDQASPGSAVKSTEEILSNGGCKVGASLHENGQEWHPVVVSYGEQKCIKCRCKDSYVSCQRRCTRATCNNRVSSKRKPFGGSTDNDECCSSQCRRSRRHQQHRRTHRDREDKSGSGTKTSSAVSSRS